MVSHRRACLALAIMLSSAPAACTAQCLEDAALTVRSPEELASWLSGKFTSSMTFPDRTHTPRETLESRSGNCDDFAVLASAMLTRMGIENRVLIIKFRQLTMSHAICIWKDRDGAYSFISNRELCRTGRKTVGDAVKRYYPDCIEVCDLDPQPFIKSDFKTAAPAARKPYTAAGPMTSLDPRLYASL